jgi:hypothetical protein
VNLRERRGPVARSLRAALLPLLLLGAVPTPGLALCAQSDAQHHHCCCPAHTAHPAQQAELSTSCCCKLEQTRTAPQPSAALRVERTGAQSVLLAAPAAADAPLLLRTASDVAPALVHARGGPPLFILHRTLLI